MGIAGFTEWFLRRFAQTAVIMDSSNAMRVDHVLVDMNQIIHLCSRKATCEEHLFVKIFSTLDKLFRLVIPVRSVFLVVDGPASKAKLIEQRRRRKARKSSSGNAVIDRLQITPGSLFMHRLKQALKYYCCSRVQSPRYKRVKFYLSGADVAGEGEIKIVRYIQVLNSQYRNNSYVIVGSDADLILLGLSLQIPNVSILASRQLANQKKKTYINLSVDVLMRELELLFPESDVSKLAIDFIVISIITGNDYIPKIYGVNLDVLWRRYIHLKRRKNYSSYLYTNGNIDVAFLLEMLQPFKAPHYQLKCPPIYFGNSQNWVHREQSPNLQPRIQPNPASAPWTAKSTPVLSSFATPLDPEAPILYIPNLGDTPQSTEDTILPGEEEIVFQPHEIVVNGTPLYLEAEPTELIEAQGDEAYEEVEEETALDRPLSWDEYDPIDHVSDYIFGIIWTIDTYIHGKSSDYGWFFHYSCGPSYQEFEYFFHAPNAMQALEQKKSAPKRFTPLPPYKFSLMLLPGDAADLLPAPMRPFLDKSHPELSALFHGPFRPYIDCDLIESVVDKAISEDKLTDEEREVMLFSHVLRYESTDREDEKFVPPPLPTKNSHPLRRPYNILCAALDDELQPLDKRLRDSARRRGFKYVARQEANAPVSRQANYRPSATASHSTRFAGQNEALPRQTRVVVEPSQHTYNIESFQTQSQLLLELQQQQQSLFAAFVPTVPIPYAPYSPYTMQDEPPLQ